MATDHHPVRDNTSMRVEIEALVRERDTYRRMVDEDAEAIKKLTSLILKISENRDAYRRVAHGILNLIHEGQARGLHDTTVNRMKSRFDVQAMGRLQAELERLERGTG